MQWIIDEIEQYLKNRGKKIEDGSVSAEELEFFVQLLKDNPEIQSIGEIGFNVGISSYAFFYARNNIRVISFDIGTHKYVKDAQDFIDDR